MEDSQKDLAEMLAQATDLSPDEIIFEEVYGSDEQISEARYNELHKAIEVTRREV